MRSIPGRQVRFIGILAVLMVALVSAGCGGPKVLSGGVKNAVKNRHVILEVTRTGGTSTLKFKNNSGCRKGPKGCVKISRNYFGSIMFFLRFGKNSERDWKFKRVELQDDEGRWPGEPGYSLDANIQSDFSLSGCPDGVVCKAWISPTGRLMIVEDKNEFKFEVDYRVVVEDDDGNELKAHPIIDNRGTNTT